MSNSKFLLAFSLCTALSLDANASNLDECWNWYDSLIESESTLSKQIQTWEGYKNQCRSTGFYEYHLGTFYLQADRFKEAKSAFAEGLSVESKFRNALLLGYGNIYLTQHDYASAEKIYKQLVHEFPSWHVGHQQLGFTLLANANHKEAIKHLNEANKIQPDSVTYRDLTLAYEAIGQDELAIESFYRGYSLDSSIQRDRIGMLTAARSNANLGNFDEAKKYLVILLKHYPHLDKETDFLETGNYIKKKMTEKGAIN